MFRRQRRYLSMKPSDKDLNKIRLQVFLSHNGVSSRRKAFDLVKKGHVYVNGQKIIEPSTPVDPQRDKILVDGHRVEEKNYSYVLLNKPRGCVTTKAQHYGERTVFDVLPKDVRHLVPVGRLDKDTEGLLLLTNDGDLAYTLTHPKFNIDKVYLVRVQGLLGQAEGHRLERGIVIDGEKTSPARISNLKHDHGQSEFLMTIHEGKKRQIRLMCEAVGCRVVNLKRVRQGPLDLGALKTGQWRFLTNEEVQTVTGLKMAS